MIRVIRPSDQKQVAGLMHKMDVDQYGIRIMAPKSLNLLVNIDPLPCISANILKQEMLSLGGDAAVSRDALTARARSTPCLLIGSLCQLSQLEAKLSRQPLGLKELGKDIARALNNYLRTGYKIKLGKAILDLSRRTHIMGILNITPDSFSSDGLLGQSNKEILRRARQMASDGADIIDIGSESSRPGARPVSVKEELRRALPVFKALKNKAGVPLSVDTRKAQVAQMALDHGAAMVNDISGLGDKKMAKLCVKYNCAVVIMHMRKDPRTMQKDIRYNCLIPDILNHLERAVKRAQDAGVKPEKIVIDPGIGFGKLPEQNLEILNRLGEFRSLGKPILVGTSRKSFIGKILNAQTGNRLNGTLSSCVIAAAKGADILRVHDCSAVAEALKVADAITREGICR
jgi:dihydropteroate synthase